MKKIILIALVLASGIASAQAQKDVSKQFVNTMATGKYTMKFRSEQKIVGQTVTFEATQYVSGDKMALTGKQGTHSVKIIVRDGKAYMIDDTSKKIFAMPNASAAKDMGINPGKFNITGSGREVFLGKNLPYDEYAVDNGVMRMYVNDGKLAGFKVTAGEDRSRWRPENIPLRIPCCVSWINRIICD